MFRGFPVRRSVSLAALAAAALLASCAQPPPAKPSPPPPISLSSQLLEQASAYRAYIAKAAQISPAFANGQQVADSLRAGASYQPDQLLRGAIAYGAVAALQDPAFVAGVRAYANDPAQRQKVAFEIMKDPAYVLGIAGASSAAGQVVSALGDDGRKLLDQGRLVKQAAYDVQRSSWSKSEVSGREARLLQTKQLSSTPALGETAETQRLQQASVGAAPLGLVGAPAGPPYSPLVVRSLALAALAGLGYADDANLNQVLPLVAEPNTATCLNMSKLNLYQCLAVSKPHYEDVFCLGVHAMSDTGACLMKGVGVTVPADPIVEAAKARAAEAAAAKAAKTAKKPAAKKKTKKG